MKRVLIVWLAACGDSQRPAIPDATVDAASACEHRPGWSAAPPLAAPTQETAVVAAAGKVYVLGGFLDGAVTDAVQVFDPATCTWSAGPKLPKPVHHANAAVVDDTIYVLGALESPTFTAIGDTWAWSPASDATWTMKTPMPTGTQRGSSVTGVIDGKIYVAGGLRSGAVVDVSMFDPTANTWTPQQMLPMPRDHACGAAIAGKLYVAGGRQTNITSTSATVFEFAPGAGWTERAAMPTGRGGTACGVVASRLVVVGGEGNLAAPSGVFSEVEAYDAATNTWASLAPMPNPRHGMGAAVIEGRLYVPGGADRQAFGAVTTHDVLVP
ncbi:MAG TPA: kelch repeat-containing protein [Kofleriaceae bacterium]|nr:kelch repeat-containing protein [Kofleriaceae bacterium]